MSYMKLFRMSLSSRLFYGAELVLGNLNLLAQVLIAISAGLYFNSVRQIMTPGELCVYYMFGAGLINTFQRKNPVRRLEQEISEGALAAQLARPYNYVVYSLVRDFSAKTYDALLTFLFSVAVLAGMIGLGQIEPAVFLRAAFIIPITLMYIYLNVMAFMYLALILEKADRLFSAYQMTSFFLGGGLVSTSYLPAFVNYLPQQFYFNSPLMFIIRGQYPNLPLFFIFTAVIILIDIWLYSLARRRLELNGA